jgi:hypothetical protein
MRHRYATTPPTHLATTPIRNDTAALQQTHNQEDDVGFVGVLVDLLASQSNVRLVDGGVTLVGTSNGAGLLLNVLINNRDKRIRRVVMEVTHLHTHMHRDGKFWLQGPNNRCVREWAGR